MMGFESVDGNGVVDMEGGKVGGDDGTEIEPDPPTSRETPQAKGHSGRSELTDQVEVTVDVRAALQATTAREGQLFEIIGSG